MSEIYYSMTQEQTNQQIENKFDEYINSKKDGKCDDCGRWGKIYEMTGCGDGEDWCDFAEGHCCVKDVCVDGCEYLCEKCENMVKANYCDGWHFHIKCKCGNIFTPKFSWYGNTPITNYQRGWLPSDKEDILKKYYR